MSCRVEVVVGSLELRGAEVEALTVHHEMSRHTVCSLSFVRDSGSAIALENLVGAEVVVRVAPLDGSEMDGQPEGPLFVGEVTSVRQSLAAPSGTHFAEPTVRVGGTFLVEAMSASHRMNAANLEFYKEQRFGDVASAIAGRHGLSIETVDGEDVREWVQTGMSDFDFLIRGADELGAYVETNLENKVAVRDSIPGPATKVVWGRDLLGLSASSTPANHGFQGGGYDLESKEALAIRGVSKEPTLLGGAAQLVGATRRSRPGPGRDFGVDIDRSRAPRPRTSRDLLLVESQRISGRTVLVEGESVNPHLRAGSKVLVDHGENLSIPIRGQFTIVSIVHRVVGGAYSNNFVASPYEITLRDRRPARQSLGGTAAVVVENVDPDRLGRVQVRYWWHDEKTEWARLVRPHGGVNRGMYFVPEIDEEVFVVFEQGDPERPLIIGSLWNGVDTPPSATREDRQNNNLKVLQTRSGNTILFDDADSEEVIEIYSAEGRCLVQLHNKFGGTPTINVYSQGDISLTSERDISLDAGRNILLRSKSLVVDTRELHQNIKNDLRAKVGGSVNVEAGGDCLVKAGGNVGHRGGKNVTSSAGANLNLAAGATANLHGSLVQIQPPGFVVPTVSPKSPDALEPKAPADDDFTPSKGSG